MRSLNKTQNEKQMADNRFPFFVPPPHGKQSSGNGLHETIVITSSQNQCLAQPFQQTQATLNQFYDLHTNPKETLSFTGYSPSANIGFAEIIGRREKAEDRVVFGIMAEFEHLPEVLRILVLQNTVARLANLAQVYDMRRSGSTLCLTVRCQNKIYTVNVGDSTAHLFLFSNGNSSCERLNTVLHHPNEPSEKKRLSKNPNAQVINNRLFYSGTYYNKHLALSRAIGDTDMHSVGLIPFQDIYIRTLAPNEEAILILGCDGLTEKDCLVTDNMEMIAKGKMSIQTLVEESRHNTSQQIAASLCNQAYDLNSHDNISTVVEKIDINASTTYMAVFDGHGGVECADLMRRNFFTVFQDEVFTFLPKNTNLFGR